MTTVIAEDATNNSLGSDTASEASWEVNTFENAIYMEFVLNLKWSLLTSNLNRYTSRLNYNNWIYNVRNVKRAEEKIALKIVNANNEPLYFTNFDSTSQINNTTKKFHNIELIKGNNGKWPLKARVWIYIHKDIDRDIAGLLLNNDAQWNDVSDNDFDMETSSLKVKSASFVFYWLRKRKIWRVIKIN